jgi:uncharacterized Tic20 family protein
MSIAMPVADDQVKFYQAPFSDAAQPQTVQPNGRVRATGLKESDRNFAIAMHLSPFGAVIIGPLAFLAPLVLWLIRKDNSVFNDDHGREIVNFMLSLIVWTLISLVAMITIVGALLIPVVCVVAVVSPIRAALAAGRGEYFRYPMTFRFL